MPHVIDFNSLSANDAQLILNAAAVSNQITTASNNTVPTINGNGIPFGGSSVQIATTTSTTNNNRINDISQVNHSNPTPLPFGGISGLNNGQVQFVVMTPADLLQMASGQSQMSAAQGQSIVPTAALSESAHAAIMVSRPSPPMVPAEPVSSTVDLSGATAGTSTFSFIPISKLELPPQQLQQQVKLPTSVVHMSPRLHSSSDGPTPPKRKSSAMAAMTSAHTSFLASLGAPGSMPVHATSISPSTSSLQQPPPLRSHSLAGILPVHRLSQVNGGPSHQHEHKEERRRSNHNEVEKRRRDKINNWLAQLSDLVPPAGSDEMSSNKQSKGGILMRTVHYIENLKSENEMLKKNLIEILSCGVANTTTSQYLENLSALAGGGGSLDPSSTTNSIVGLKRKISDVNSSCSDDYDQTELSNNAIMNDSDMPSGSSSRQRLRITNPVDRITLEDRDTPPCRKFSTATVESSYSMRSIEDVAEGLRRHLESGGTTVSEPYDDDDEAEHPPRRKISVISLNSYERSRSMSPKMMITD